MLSIKQSESQGRSAVKTKQPRRLLLALLLLVLAFAAVIVRDHDFWFTSDQTSDLDAAEPEATDQTTAKSTPTETAPVAASPVATTAAAPKQQITAPTKPAPTKPVQTKPVVNKPVETKSAVAKAIGGPATPKTAETKATETKPAEAPVVATNRTAVAPLDVEVVAGDTHKTLRPGSNALKVEIMKPGTASHSTFAGATSAAERQQLQAQTAAPAQTSISATYPALAQNMKVQGSVVLQALIGADGVIQNLRVLSGPAILASAAQQAVREWHFKPYLQNGQAVETKATITVNFTIKVGENTATQVNTGL